LLDGITFEKIRSLAHDYDKGQINVINAFNDADDQFSWFYTMEKLNPKWLEVIIRQVNNSEDPSEGLQWESLLERFYSTLLRELPERPDSWSDKPNVLRRANEIMSNFAAYRESHD
jgi:hypothetical protein